MSQSAADRVQRARRAVTATVVLAQVMFAVADDRAALGIIVSALLIGLHRMMRARWYITTPRWVLNGVLVLVAGAGALSWSAATVSVSVFAWFLIAVLVVKMFDRRLARDEGQLLTLAVFLALATALTDVGLLVGLMLLVLVPVLIDAAVRVQLLVAREAAGGSTIAVTTSGLGSRPPHKRISVFATVGVVAISILVFVLIPRQLFQGGLGSLHAPFTQGSTSRFTDQISLGARGIISQSSEPVLDLRLEDSNGNLLGGPNQVFYLRGAVLDKYTQGRWVLSDVTDQRPKLDVSAGLETPFAAPPPSEVSTIVQHIVLKRSDPLDQVLFAVWRPYSVQIGMPATIRRMSGEVMRAISNSGQLSYTVWSSQYDRRSASRLRRSVEPLPVDRLNEWARGVLVAKGIEPDPALRAIDADGPAARALADAASACATYTLDQPPVPSNTDPTEWFLFEAKRGHCEYFASTLAAACRAVGIDSRVVAGYIAVEYNAAGGYYLVRQSHAHAWVEASIGGGVWITLDPTPQAELMDIHVPKPTLRSRIGGVMHAIEYAWVTQVVDFGGKQPWSRSQQGSMGPRASDAIEPGAGRLPIAQGLGGALGVGALVLMVWMVRRHRARTRPLASPELASLWRSAERALRNAGVACPSWRGGLEHAANVRAVSHEAGAAFERFVHAMYEARYAGERTSPSAQAECRRLLDAFKSALGDSRTRGGRPNAPDAA